MYFIIVRVSAPSCVCFATATIYLRVPSCICVFLLTAIHAEVLSIACGSEHVTQYNLLFFLSNYFQDRVVATGASFVNIRLLPSTSDFYVSVLKN